MVRPDSRLIVIELIVHSICIENAFHQTPSLSAVSSAIFKKDLISTYIAEIIQDREGV
jgi:hypothetical protein